MAQFSKYFFNQCWLSLMGDYPYYHIALLQDLGGGEPDLDYDITPAGLLVQEASFKGYAQVIANSGYSNAWNAGANRSEESFPEATFLYDSGEAGDASNTKTSWVLMASNDGVTPDIVIVAGHFGAPMVLDADGQGIPLTVTPALGQCS